jgi:hypothetical protein
LLRWFFDPARRERLRGLICAWTPYPRLPPTVLAALERVAANPALLVPSCALDAFLAPALRTPEARAGVVGRTASWLSDAANHARLCADRRRAHRGRIGPRVAAALTAASLAAIGCAPHLDLFAMAALAAANDVRLRVACPRARVYVVNACGSATRDVTIVGSRSAAHCVSVGEFYARQKVGRGFDETAASRLKQLTSLDDVVRDYAAPAPVYPFGLFPFARRWTRSRFVSADGDGLASWTSPEGGRWRVGA